MVKGSVFELDNVQNNLSEFNSRLSNLAIDINTNCDRFSSHSEKSLDKLSELAAFHFAETNGLRLKIITNDWLQLCHQDYPSVVKYSDGRFILLIRASDVGVLLFDYNDLKTSIVSKEHFLESWTGHALTFHNKPKV